MVTIVLAYLQMRTRNAIKESADENKEAAKKAAVQAEEVQEVAKKTADKAAVKVEEVKQTAKKTAEKVEEVKIAAVEVAAQVSEVKETLRASNNVMNEKIEELVVTSSAAQRVGEAVHTLVNSSFSNQLKISKIALRRVADLTKHPDDITAAKLAEEAYKAHEEKQKIVDEGKKVVVSTPS